MNDQDRVDYINSYAIDFRKFAAEQLTVRDHNTASLVPFKFRKPQEILHKIVEKQKAETGRVRILNLKARRYGGSTYVEGRFYWKTSLNANRSAFIIAHEEDSTNTLFKMANLFHEQNKLAPSTRKTNAKELIFDKVDGTGLKSEYRLATARNVHAGKSQGIHYLHDSEEAQWEGNPEELLTSLFACVPTEGDTEIFRESTAQGYGNTFQEDCFTAFAEGKYPYFQEDGITYAWHNPLKQNFEWILVFIPWFSIEIYTMPFESEEAKEAFSVQIQQKVFDERDMRWVESEALRLKKRYKLTLEQLNWRDWCIENMCRGSVDKFHQNYPSTVEEAFLSRGANVFGKEMCDELEAQCSDPIVTGDVVRLAGKIRIKRNRHGCFSLWEKPGKDDIYFITIDSAGGKKESAQERKKIDKEPDKTNIDVWNHGTGNQAAQWNGHIDYDLISDVAIMIGELYNNATACVEAMNHGFTVIADLSRESYPQYEPRPKEYGWTPTKKTKPEAVDTSYKMARDADLKINSKQTVSEMRTYIEDPPGQFNAASGCNDDRVTSLYMASQMMLRLPKSHVDRGKKPFRGFRNFKERMRQPIEDTYKEVYVA